MSNANTMQRTDMSDYPLANTEARRMMAEGLERLNDEKKMSQRAVAKQLGYKSSVVVSHMASGRAPIPIDRVPDFARILGLDVKEFLLAVLDQRYPDVNFKRILDAKSKSTGATKSGFNSYVADELEAIAGRPLDEMTTDKVEVLRQVAADKAPTRRWISLSEMPMIEKIRSKFPGGMSIKDRGMFDAAVDAL